jgi:hypothetical protein
VIINFFMLNMPLLLGAKKKNPEALYERSLSAPASISLLISRHPHPGLCEPARPVAKGFASAIYLIERFHPQYGHLQHRKNSLEHDLPLAQLGRTLRQAHKPLSPQVAKFPS